MDRRTVLTALLAGTSSAATQDFFKEKDFKEGLVVHDDEEIKTQIKNEFRYKSENVISDQPLYLSNREGHCSSLFFETYLKESIELGKKYKIQDLIGFVREDLVRQGWCSPSVGEI